MFRSTQKTLSDVAAIDEFSLYSSKKGDIASKGTADILETPKKNYDPVLAGVGETSPNLGMMVDQLLSTPEQEMKNVSSDSVVGESLKNLDLNDESSPTFTWGTSVDSLSLGSLTYDNSGSACGLFSTAKYYDAFGTEPANMINWTEVDSLGHGKSQRHYDSSLCGSSEGSSLSISLCQSTSISPLNETSGSVEEDVSRRNFYTSTKDEYLNVQHENLQQR